MVQKKLPLINSAHGSETRNIINELIKLFNGMGYTYNEALNKAHNVLDEAKQTNDMNTHVNNRLDNIIAESGTSSTEVVDARGTHTVLSGRLNEINQQIGDVSLLGSNYRSLIETVVERGVNVKDFGALGDGETDDTEAFNDAISHVSDLNGGGNIIVPPGTYMIHAHIDDGGNRFTHRSIPSGIIMKDNTNLIMHGETYLKAIPNEYDRYKIISIFGVENVGIYGGNIIGDRENHIGSTGEWGAGIQSTVNDNEKRSENIRIENVYIRDCWGDGIVSGNTKNLTINNVTSDNNRRQGLSIVGGIDVFVTNSKFINTNGTLPQSGVDVEPDGDRNLTYNISFKGCEFTGNQGRGFICDAQHSELSRITLEDCLIEKNKSSQVVLTANGGLLHDVSLLRCDIKGDDSHSTTVSITQGSSDINDVYNIVIKDCNISGLERFHLWGVKTVSILNTHFYMYNSGVAEIGFRLQNTEDVIFDGCFFHADTNSLFIIGANYQNNKGLSIVNCTALNLKSRFFLCNGSAYMTTISNNKIYHNSESTGTPIELNDGDIFILNNNIIETNRQRGVSINSGAHNVNAIGNIVKSTLFAVVNSSETSVEANNILIVKE